VRVRWRRGEREGMDFWVPRRRLVAPWAEADALLEDERRTLAALEATGATAAPPSAPRAWRLVLTCW
jgi:hypothetical protein